MKLADYTHKPTFSSTRDGFGVGLKEAATKNENIVALCADLTESTRVNLFKEKFPNRFIEMGIAEENMIGISAGLALTGKIPFASSYSVFIVNNALGPIRASVCYTNSNVKIIGGHSGLSATQDGATHQALEDIAVMRTLPNMTVIVPCDEEEARKATLAIAEHAGPTYLRVGKHKTLNITNHHTPFHIGKANTLVEGSDVTIISCGAMVEQALHASEQLNKEYSVKVINMHTIKPLDSRAVLNAAQHTRAIITIEEHQRAGGLGSTVAEVLAQSDIQTKLTIMGVNDSFGESGNTMDLFKKHKLTATDIAHEVRVILDE